MITALDSSVLIALFNKEADYQDWYPILDEAELLVISHITLAEFSQNFPHPTDCLIPLTEIGVEITSLTNESAFLAGQTYKQYRRNKGPRTTLIPDFLIAAHAQLQSDQLASIDRGFHRTYFPDLKIISPD
ncbi:MAG: PIN domain-containing protein [Verrucomicrobiota bacterium]